MYYQRKVPPPNRVLNFSLQNMTGGLNNRSTELRENQASKLMNMAFKDETTMWKRKGTELVDDFWLGESVTFIGEYKPYTGSNQLIRATDTEIFGDRNKIADVAGRITAVNYMGKFMYCDGEGIYLYGIFPKANALPYLAVIGTPIETECRMKLVNPPTDYTPLGTEHVTGVFKYDYTKLECWYEPCLNEVKDTYKGANVLPEKPKYIATRLDRLYISGSENDDDNVFISDISNGFYFPVFLPIQMPPNSDKVTGIINYHDTMVAGRGNDLHVIYGNTNRSDFNAPLFRLAEINSHTGFANQHAIDHVHNYLFYIGSDGNAYRMHTTETDVKLLMTTILNDTVDFEREPVSASKEDILNSKSIFFDDEWYVAMGDKVLVYSYRHMAWTVYKFAGFNISYFYKSDNELLLGTDHGFTIKFTDERLDLGAPYQALWTSRYIDLGNAIIFKHFREVFLVSEAFNETDSDITLKFEVDYSDVDSDVVIQNNISRWGKSRWGDRFINRNIVASYPILIGVRGRAIRITYSNSYFPSAPVDSYNDLEGYPLLKEGTLVFVNDEQKYYLYTSNEWKEQDIRDLSQMMCVYEINGQYELRGQR